MPVSVETTCLANQVAQYVDGELDHNAEVLFERHLAECGNCRDELRAQQLFTCELDAALSHSFELEVPKDFSRRVAARATSDMSGVRSPAEHKKALAICLTLAIVGFALVGATARDSLLLLGRKFLNGIWGLLSFVSVALYDVGVSVAVIVKVLSRKLVVESGSSGYLLVVFALAVLLLSRLISKYHRTGAH
jgi:anti-sigma factor RsiW